MGKRLDRTIVVYLLKKLALYIGTFFVAATINFLIPRLIPGDPIEIMLSELVMRGGTVQGGEEILMAFRQRFGLDKPMITQFVSYFERLLLHGDLGYSIINFPLTVQEIIGRALPWTIGLLSVTVLLSWTIGNLLGAFIGWRRGGKIDTLITSVCLCLNQIPYYFCAIILIYLFAFLLPIFPISGIYNYTSLLDSSLSFNYVIEVLYHSILPALSIILVQFGGWMIMMRSMIVSVIGEDYLKLAIAKGLTKRKILMKYAFRNALLPQVTALAMALGFTLSGAMLTEVIFAYPGVGYLMYKSLLSLDYPVLQGILIFVVGAVLAANMFIDLLYPFIDPRIGHKV